MRYELFYWPSIQGRGEFVRLALEEAGADYVDVARVSEQGIAGMLELMEGASLRPPFAPPFLRTGEQVIAQTAHILYFLGRRLGIAPKEEASQMWAHQLQLTVEDLVVDIHAAHHPAGSGLYYHEQKPEARRRAAFFTAERAPELLGYFEKTLQRNPASKGYMIGDSLSYVDLSMFQIITGLRYAYPNIMTKLEPRLPGLVELHDRIMVRPKIKVYLASARRITFNNEGIFRHYPELDRD